MEVQIQEIVDKIKRDGLETAEQKANEIIQLAEQKAKKIVQDAQAEKDALIRKGKEEADRFEKAAISSIEQASRNTLLSFRDGINKQLNAIMQSSTKNAYDATVLKSLLPEAIKSWVQKNEEQDQFKQPKYLPPLAFTKF